jgi:hypothetical protein
MSTPSGRRMIAAGPPSNGRQRIEVEPGMMHTGRAIGEEPVVLLYAGLLEAGPPLTIWVRPRPRRSLAGVIPRDGGLKHRSGGRTDLMDRSAEQRMAADRSLDRAAEVTMRVTVIILSSFAGLVLVIDAAVPIRLTSLTGSGVSTPDVVGTLALFVAWTVGTALVYPAPTLARWCFTVASVTGLAVGISLPLRVLIVWGTIAGGLALLTTLAQREKRRADQRDWQREQQDKAVYLAMRSLQETVPELLARVPAGDSGDVPTVTPPMPTSVPSGLVRGTRR